jgi:hypothetical protein
MGACGSKTATVAPHGDHDEPADGAGLPHDRNGERGGSSADADAAPADTGSGAGGHRRPSVTPLDTTKGPLTAQSQRAAAPSSVASPQPTPAASGGRGGLKSPAYDQPRRTPGRRGSAAFTTERKVTDAYDLSGAVLGKGGFGEVKIAVRKADGAR